MPRRPTQSRLHGARGFLAPWYKALFPMTPVQVRALRPSEIASILGLDRHDAVIVVPLTDEMLADAAPPPEQVRPVKPAGQQRLRMVRSFDG
jgi:hypothetical protein